MDVKGDISDTSSSLYATFYDCQLSFDGPVQNSGTLKEETTYAYQNYYYPDYVHDTYMTDIVMTDGGTVLTASAGTQIEWFYLNTTTPMTQISTQSETGGEVDRIENLVIKFDLSAHSFCFASGKVYLHNDLTRYLMIDQEYDPYCSYPFVSDLSGNLTSGSMAFIGTDGNATLEVTSDNNITIYGSDGNVTVITVGP